MDQNIFTWIGFLTSSYIGLKLFYKLFHACRVYVFPSYPDLSKYGKWSVVTGGTNGLGKAIAFQLASKGQNVALIARNKTLLEEVSQEIKSQYGVETAYLQVDFSHDESIYEKIEDFLKDLDIGVLINNVGIAQNIDKYLNVANLSSHLTDITRVNMFSMFKMHQIVLPGMVQRKRGLIVNLSSASAVRPLPCFNIYGATKAFVNYFSQSLRYEYADKGVTIQTCIPFFVQSNMTKGIKSYTSMIKADDYAASWLATVDKERVTHGCWQHALQGFFMNLCPLQIISKMIENSVLRRKAKERKIN